MTDHQPIDPERLAALLDGRLSEAEAAAVREQLGRADDDTLAAYADAVAIAAEIDAAPVVIPIDSRRPGRRWRTPAFVAAAAAAAIAVFLFRPSTQSDAYAPAQFAAAVPASASTAGGPVWGVTRGSGDGVSDRVRAVRVGALLTDVALDAIRGDTSRAHVIALASLLEGSLGGMAVAAPYRALASASESPTPAQTDSLGRHAMLAVDGPLARAGAYLEAARLATAAGDTSYFDRVPPDALTAIAGDQRLDATARAAITNVVALTRASPRNAAAIGAAVSTLLSDLTQ